MSSTGGPPGGTGETAVRAVLREVNVVVSRYGDGVLADPKNLRAILLDRVADRAAVDRTMAVLLKSPDAWREPDSWTSAPQHQAPAPVQPALSVTSTGGVGRADSGRFWLLAAIGVAAAVALVVALVVVLGGDDDEPETAADPPATTAPSETPPSSPATTTSAPPTQSPAEILEARQPRGVWRMQQVPQYDTLVDGTVTAASESGSTVTWRLTPSGCKATRCTGTVQSSAGRNFGYTWDGVGLRIEAYSEVKPVRACVDSNGKPVDVTGSSFQRTYAYSFSPMKGSSTKLRGTYHVEINTRVFGTCTRNPKSVMMIDGSRVLTQ